MVPKVLSRAAISLFLSPPWGVVLSRLQSPQFWAARPMSLDFGSPVFTLPCFLAAHPDADVLCHWAALPSSQEMGKVGRREAG